MRISCDLPQLVQVVDNVCNHVSKLHLQHVGVIVGVFDPESSDVPFGGRPTALVQVSSTD